MGLGMKGTAVLRVLAKGLVLSLIRPLDPAASSGEYRDGVAGPRRPRTRGCGNPHRASAPDKLSGKERDEGETCKFKRIKGFKKMGKESTWMIKP